MGYVCYHQSRSFQSITLYQTYVVLYVLRLEAIVSLKKSL